MYIEEDMFATAEADADVSAKAHRARKRIQNRLTDRTKKRHRHLKKGHTELQPWLQREHLDQLSEQLRVIDSTHHRDTRTERAVRQDTKSLRPVAMKHLQPGVIIDCWVPFTDTDDYKRRPAVVVEANKHEVRVFPLTTSLGHRRLKTPIYLLHHWAESGLNRPTGMQRREATIARSDVLGFSGELIGEDRSEFFRWRNANTRKTAAVTHLIAEAAAASHPMAA